ISAARAMIAASAPYNWMPMGRSASSNRMSSNRCAMPLATPTAEMNSETTTSAPNPRHSSRHGDSEPPAIGARQSGNPCATGSGQNIAIPHCRAVAVSRLRVAFGRKLEGIDFNAIDGKPVQFFFLIVAPPLEVSNQYLPVLGKIAQFAKETDVPEKLVKVGTPQEFLKLLEDKNI